MSKVADTLSRWPAPSAWIATIAAPAAVISDKARLGSNIALAATVVISVLVSGSAGVVGTWVTMRKTRSDLATQLHADTGKFLDRQTVTIKEQDDKINALQQRLDELWLYIVQDVAWHQEVIALLHQHRIDVPSQPPKPAGR